MQILQERLNMKDLMIIEVEVISQEELQHHLFLQGRCEANTFEKGIIIGSHILSIGNVFDSYFDGVNLKKQILVDVLKKRFPCN